MIEALAGLGRTLGFSLTSGVNLYATVAVLGLASKFQWVTLPPQYQIFNNDWVIGGAITLYLIEFVADSVLILVLRLSPVLRLASTRRIQHQAQAGLRSLQHQELE